MSKLYDFKSDFVKKIQNEIEVREVKILKNSSLIDSYELAKKIENITTQEVRNAVLNNNAEDLFE